VVLQIIELTKEVWMDPLTSLITVLIAGAALQSTLEQRP
jgi:hypothetical protein